MAPLHILAPAVPPQHPFPAWLVQVSGRAALELEESSPADCVARALEALRTIYGAQGIEVPEPVSAAVSRWGKDPWTFGSYSSVSVGCRGGQEYMAMAEPVMGGKVCFAGEATTHKYPATMHGAFLSGGRANAVTCSSTVSACH